MYLSRYFFLVPLHLGGCLYFPYVLYHMVTGAYHSQTDRQSQSPTWGRNAVEASRRPLAQLLAGLPPALEEGPALAAIRARNANDPRAVVVLDDDPTGTQTVYDVSVYTHWDVDTLTAALREERTGFYVLTNSRGLPEAEAVALNRELATNLRTATNLIGRPVTLVSRGDSTLRGHYPAETDALALGMAGTVATTGMFSVPTALPQVVLAPFFAEGKRITVGGVHWVHDGKLATPVGETEFARDRSFGFSASDLPGWVAEKTGGRVPREAVGVVPLATIRAGAEAVTAWLIEARQPVLAVESAEDGDIAVFVLGMLGAEKAGRQYLARTAAAFVRARFGLPRRPSLDPARAVARQGPGLVVVGSYVPRSTAQLAAVRALSGIRAVEVSVDDVLGKGREAAIDRAVTAVGEAWAAGDDAVLFTSRALRISYGDDASNLRIGQGVSAALVAIVRALSPPPAWFIAKGGVTSSDMATEALGIRHATVLGALLPGVPVWRAVVSERWGAVPLVVFPGNVGGTDDLAHAVTDLHAAAHR